LPDGDAGDPLLLLQAAIAVPADIARNNPLERMVTSFER
jgi:hypothetical protein